MFLKPFCACNRSTLFTAFIFYLWSNYGCVLTIAADTVVLNAGSNTTLPCWGQTKSGAVVINRRVYWQWKGVKSSATQPVTADGMLPLVGVMPASSGTYTCHSMDDDSIIVEHTLLVPGPPSAPVNLTVNEMDEVLVLRWHNTYTQDYLAAAPDTTLRLRYRPLLHPVLQLLDGDDDDGDSTGDGRGHAPANEELVGKWHQLPHTLTPGQNFVAIQHLHESESYEFELWAENSYGGSSRVTVTTSSPHHSPTALTRTGAWARSRGWLGAAVAVLAVSNAVAGAVWLLHCVAANRRRQRRQRVLANHLGLSNECEQLELVCHAQDLSVMDSTLSLTHHAALV